MLEILKSHDAMALADLVRRRKVSALEVLQASINAAERLNPDLNAIITPLYDQAKAQLEAGLPEGPFYGVPFLVKDLAVSMRGVPTTMGSRLAEKNVPAFDSEIISRYRRAGLVIMGRTNSSEFGLFTATEPKLHGPTNNPWNLRHSPGGSSGGSAAAVAAGIVPMAHATDGGGSIRIPAACCGLFGLKPTRARITSGPDGGEAIAGMAVQHALCWSVRDSAALLDATAGPMPGDPYFPGRPSTTYLEAAGQDPKPLRIAFSAKAPNGAAIDKEAARAVIDVAGLCEDLGHEVVEDAPDFAVEALQDAFLKVFAANCMANILRLSPGGLPGGDLLEPLTRAVAEMGRSMDATSYIHALQLLHREARNIAGFYERFDIWLTPTLAGPAPRTGYFDNDQTDVEEWLRQILSFSPFTFLCNVTGQPAMTLPLAISGSSLPLGCHFAAPYGREDMLFSLAGQIERATPWKDRRPPAL